jgi:hypothetical protein
MPPDECLPKHSGNESQRNATEMIERRKICQKPGEDREQSGEENFPLELKVTILHEPSIVNFLGQDNQLTG